MKIIFWGAAQQVTGSLFQVVLEDGYTILIDCGMNMERNKEKQPKPLYKGACFPFDASMVQTVLLTHAHLDHSGRIPNLFKDGFEGQILCTTPTMQLANIILRDSARINQMKLRKYQKRRSRNPEYAPDFNIGELYTEKEAGRAIDRFVPIATQKPFRITDNISATFLTTGHLLGATSILLEVTENGETKSILFSGDVGRYNYPLLLDPVEMPQADYVICETTYGNREHQANGDLEDDLAQLIQETCIDTPGRLIIPAFSIGRTQALLYSMNKISKNRGLPPIKVFSDSPMAHASNQVYQKNVHRMNKEAQEFNKTYGELFDFSNLVYIEDNQSSRALSNYSEPCIIISSSGMIDGGRIQHHVKNNISNPYCTIYMVGYSAEGTLGRRLLDGEKLVRIGKHDMPVAARIVHTDAFSGHGDFHDLLHFVGQQNPSQTKGVFLVHGELASMESFKGVLEEKGYSNVNTPAPGQVFEL